MPLFSPSSFLLRRRPSPLRVAVLRSFSSPPEQAPPPSPIPSLSSRLSFIFDHFDNLENSQQSKTDSLLRLRHWHQSQPPPQPHISPPLPQDLSISITSPVGDSTTEGGDTMRDVLKKEVELVHPWPEWIELMQRLAQQKYFDFGRCSEEEGRVASDAGIDLSGIGEEMGLDFSRDWTTVRNACMNFGRDRFDLLRSLSRHDLQILVGHGCPNMDPKVVFSAKLLRKLVRLDEGDVCSSCNLRNSCNRGYILTRKEDEARTLDVMRILLTFSFDHVNGCVENKPLTKMKSVKTVVRKLLHEIVKLSAVPIDPNLPPPVIKKPPPKVKQPPPPPKKRVGRDDVEMKKGDWLCTKCDFMNFAKNIVCLKCDAKRPKRQLLPGEWECPGCNFLNYRRNMVCHHCEHKRPPDSYIADQHQTKQPDPRIRTERIPRKQDVSDAFNLDFDDNESDGADVAAFEFADPHRNRDVLDNLSHGEIDRRYEDTGRSRRPIGNTRGFEEDKRHNIRQRTAEHGGYFKEADDNAALNSHRTGFDDFDDEEEDDVDSYELEGSNVSRGSEVARRNFSEIEESDSDGFDEFDHQTSSMHGTKEYSSDSEDDANADGSYRRSSHSSNSKEKSKGTGGSHYSRGMPFCSDDDIDDSDDDVSASDLRKVRKLNDHRVMKGMGSDSDEFPVRYDSDDGGDLYSDGRRRGNNYGFKGSRKEFGSVEGMNDRRASFGGRHDDRPPRGSSMHNGPLRRSGRPLRYESDDGGDLNSDGNRRGNNYGSRGPRKEFGSVGRMNYRRDSLVSCHDDRPPRGSGMHHGPRRSGMDGKGPRGNGHSRFGDKDKFKQFDRQGDWGGSEFGQQRR